MDIGKRPRDDATADIVAEALEAESKAKIVKNEENKVKRSGDKREKKGKTLEEIEAEDGGPVREAMVGMAHTKRAIMRKEKSEGAAEDTNLVTDTADFEKELEVEEEDGITMEPFNLTNERQYGHFDDGGNYVKVKNDEEEELARDAWLALNQEAAMVAPEVLKRMQREHENITKMDEELEQLSGPEIARLKKQVADLMSDGETVVRALARLGGGGHRRPAVRTSKKNPPRTKPSAMDGTLGQQTAAQGAPETGAAGSTPAGLNTLLELVHRLIEAGEAEIYAEKKEDLLQAAALYAPAQAAEADFDMFGDEEQPPVAPARQAASATAEPASRASAQENAESAAARSVSAEPAVDYNSWPVRELRRFLEERGIDTASIVEKAELVAHVRQEAEKGPEGEGGLAAPEGYVYDHSSGYYYSPTSQLYFDAGSGSFYDSRTSQWLTSDPTVHT